MGSHSESLVTKGRIFRAIENATRGMIFSGGVPAPTLISVVPANAMQGETKVVTMTGTNLNTVIGIDFGAGIVVDAPLTKTKTEIVVVIRISASAIIGYRDVSVSTAKATATLVNGFEVLILKAEPTTGGGAGKLKGVLVPILVIKKRKYLEDVIAIKVQKARGIDYDLAIRISKRVDTLDSLSLGVSQTRSDGGFLVLAVDKQGDFAGMQILQTPEFMAMNIHKALSDQEYDVEMLLCEEIHALNANKEYSGIEQRLYSIGGKDHE